MATHTFTYKVPDELHVNSWANNATKTGTLKMDNASEKIWFHRSDMEEYWNMFATSFNEGIDSIGQFPPSMQSELREVTVSPDNDANKMALWLAKYNAVGELMDSDEWPDETYVDTQVPGKASDYTYKKMADASVHPNWVWELALDDQEDTIDFVFRNKQDVTNHDILAHTRRHQVKFYQDNFDLGADVDSDATAFIAKCDQFLTDNEPVRQWMLDPLRKDDDNALVPKMPITVTTAIGNIPEKTIEHAELNYTPWSDTSVGRAYLYDTPIIKLSDLD